MTELEKFGDEVARKSGELTPFNAGDAVAALADYCQGQGIILAPSIKARLGKASKALLTAGFPAHIVVAACIHAVRTGWYGSAESIAQEMQVMSVGMRESRADLQFALDEMAHRMRTSDSVVWQIVRERAGHVNGSSPETE